MEIVRGTASDDRNDSRTSLTDSGHGTDSRVPSCYEEETLQRKKDGKGAMKKEVTCGVEIAKKFDTFCL